MMRTNALTAADPNQSSIAAPQRGFSLLDQRGFSLLELMLSILILSVVVAVVVQGLSGLQQRDVGELNRVDLTQETRQFRIRFSGPSPGRISKHRHV
jgi:prepilin-type N-terminal cleavage/methylation domain-containing protein